MKLWSGIDGLEYFTLSHHPSKPPPPPPVITSCRRRRRRRRRKATPVEPSVGLSCQEDAKRYVDAKMFVYAKRRADAKVSVNPARSSLNAADIDHPTLCVICNVQVYRDRDPSNLIGFKSDFDKYDYFHDD